MRRLNPIEAGQSAIDVPPVGPPVKQEQSTAWELRGLWAGRKEVRLTLTERCMIRTVVGYVSNVAVTGSFAVVDGWHVPLVEVLGTARPTVEDRDGYIAEVRRLRAAGYIDRGHVAA